MKMIPDGSVDCIITDPPYNLGQFMHDRNTNLVKMRANQFAYAGWDNLDYKEWKQSMKMFLSECSRVLKKGGALIVFMAVIKVADIISLAENTKLYYKTTGVWHKTNPMPRNMNIHFVNSTESWIYFVNNDTSGTFNNDGKVVHDFLESSVCPLSEKKHGKHPTQKPVRLIKRMLDISAKKGDTILVPFVGSGTDCVAAKTSGLHYVGFELEDEYIKIASERLKHCNNDLTLFDSVSEEK
jgi:DNA modification methylase